MQCPVVIKIFQSFSLGVHPKMLRKVAIVKNTVIDQMMPQDPRYKRFILRIGAKILRCCNKIEILTIVIVSPYMIESRLMY